MNAEGLVSPDILSLGSANGEPEAQCRSAPLRGVRADICRDLGFRTRSCLVAIDGFVTDKHRGTAAPSISGVDPGSVWRQMVMPREIFRASEHSGRGYSGTWFESQPGGDR